GAGRNGLQVFCSEATGFGDTHDAAIVAAVGAVFTAVVMTQNTIQIIAEGKLFSGGFAAGQVKIQLLFADGLILLAEFLLAGLQLLLVQESLLDRLSMCM